MKNTQSRVRLSPKANTDEIAEIKSHIAALKKQSKNKLMSSSDLKTHSQKMPLSLVTAGINELAGQIYLLKQDPQKALLYYFKAYKMKLRIEGSMS